jgi:CRISPR-associated protein Csd2
MESRGLYVFEHEGPLGNARAHQLFDLVTAAPRDKAKAPRAFGDYDVRVDGKEMPVGGSWTHADHSAIPEGVTLTRLV